MSKRIKVLLIQEELKNYRDPIYSLISEKVDLTVAYTTSNEIARASYPIISLPYRKIGPILWHKNLTNIINNYDVVIFVPHLRMLRVSSLPFFPHKPKLITWSLGVHASYKRLYDLNKAPDLKNVIFETIQDSSDACIFYMPEPIDYWSKYKRIDTRKYFVAHNTVAISKYDQNKIYDRDIILFVGTLYQQKGIEELVTCYAKAKQTISELPKLKIVGKGPEKALILKMIEELNLQEDIELTGPIYDEDQLKDYFLRAIICVSPKQAGLTVLKSLGYGVPFITRGDAITGGEKSNVENGVTGIFYNSEEELVNIIAQTSTNPVKFADMSRAAINYYKEEASPEIMAQGVIDAIEYVIKKDAKIY